MITVTKNKSCVLISECVWTRVRARRLLGNEKSVRQRARARVLDLSVCSDVDYTIPVPNVTSSQWSLKNGQGHWTRVCSVRTTRRTDTSVYSHVAIPLVIGFSDTSVYSHVAIPFVFGFSAISRKGDPGQLCDVPVWEQLTHWHTFNISSGNMESHSMHSRQNLWTSRLPTAMKLCLTKCSPCLLNFYMSS